MDKHWSNYATLSIVHFMAFPQTMNGEGPIVETVGKIAEDPFFTGIEVGWIKDPKVRAATKAVLEASHIKVGYGAQPSLLTQKLNLNSLDETERQKAVDQLKANVAEAAEMGAKRIGFLSGKDPGDAERPKALAALIESVKEVCDYAHGPGVALTCETFDRTVDKKALIGPSEYAVVFAKEVRKDFPDFGLMYDLSHQPLLFEKSEPALTLLKDVLVHAHVGNCVVDPNTPGYGDLHPRFGWPGGCNDVGELVTFIRALFKIGYLAEGRAEKPWIGFEVKPQSAAETSEQIIAGTKRVWEEAWARV
ncbi:MAG: sugar phosphate isomerase/epimerase [Chloroflexi bacterium]|nr:sugar phosphate isomerase/epimerase [Chloroflexota bacterium]